VPHAKDDKVRRQKLIRSLIERNDVRDQRELLALLAVEGVRTTQSTLSRDLATIGVAKGPRGYEIVPAQTSPGDQRQANRVIRDAVESVAVSGAMLVLRTSNGYATVLAQELDGGVLESCLGTIAGKDTVFAAMPSSAAAHQAQRDLRKLMNRRRVF